VRKLAICGCGLIGGSLALDVQARGRGVEIAVWDRPGVLGRIAADRRLRVRPEASFRHAVAGADVIVLAAPPTANGTLLRRLAARPEVAGALILDTGSVKKPIADLAGSLTFPPGTQFLPSHPMAGREKSGSAAAAPGLFAGRPWFIDETVRLSVSHRARWNWLRAAVGATPVLIDSALHDELMAELSHLPQLLATVLGAQTDPRTVELAGPGLASVLRLAGSPHAVWAEIIEANRAPILAALRLYRDNLNTVMDRIARGESLRDVFAAAARSYRCLS